MNGGLEKTYYLSILFQVYDQITAISGIITVLFVLRIFIVLPNLKSAFGKSESKSVISLNDRNGP
jgi:hypothetical protein